jgi:hypothetical protein
MSKITADDLRTVTYLDVTVLGDRAANLMPLWDGARWHMWLPGPHGLVNTEPIDAVQVDYVAKEPADKSDLLIPFVHLMWQRASWPEVCPLIRAICEDFHNMGTSIARLRLFFDSREALAGGLASRFAATELEYLIILARTVFDLLQEMASRIWQVRVRLSDESAERPSQPTRRSRGTAPASQG